jgi:hypothetical protein
MTDKTSDVEVLQEAVASLRDEVQVLRVKLDAASRRANTSLREGLRCPGCGGTTILHAPQVLDRADGGGRAAMALVQPSMWRSTTIGELEVYFCKRCGLAEWYVKDTTTIHADGEQIRELDGSRGPTGGAYR